MFTLASTSAIRQKVLREAAIPHRAVASGVDEEAIKRRMAGMPVEEIALALAEAKAQAVAENRGGLVLGADQILSFDGSAYDKVADLAEARSRLRTLAGREHQLVGAYVLCKDGAVWQRHVRITRLFMRDFSDGFLEEYLSLEGENLLSSVGCYRLEGPGAQLFSRIEGDYFSILGLDLFWLCDVLREERILTP